MAEKACHTFTSTTQVGLTQALGELMSSNATLHYRYAIVGLVLMLALAIGWGFYDDKDFVDKISLALTINSLALGFVAIIYTFLAANKQDAQVTKLIETNQSISSASADIRTTANSMLQNVAVLPSRLDQVDERLRVIAQNALNVPSPAEQEEINKAVREAPKAGEGEPSATAKDFQKYLLDLPYAGIAVLYLFYKAHLASRNIDEDLTTKITGLPFAFHHGLLRGAEASGYLKISYSKNVIGPTELEASIKANMPTYIQGIRKALENEQENRLIKMLDAVDEKLP